MMKEGFEDSASNESYRQLIKSEQMKNGTITKLEKHVDLIADNKIESIKEMVGELKFSKLEVQAESLAMNRTKRALAKEVVLIEAIERVLGEKDFAEVKFEPFYNPRFKTKKMNACISDLHYGAKVDIEGNIYNTDVARELLMLYADKLLAIAKMENVEEIRVMNTGDLIEHAYMRNTQAFGVEEVLSKQITDASELIIDFLLKLSQHVKVTYSGINGNHDRINGNKNDSLYGDGAVSISNSIIKVFTQYSDSGVVFEEAEPYHHIVQEYGRNFLYVHGDMTPMKKKSILAELSKMYGIDFDAVIGGHIHHFTMTEVGRNQYVVTFGSLKGNDEYTIKTLGVKSSRSQGIVLVDEDGEFEIRKVNL